MSDDPKPIVKDEINLTPKRNWRKIFFYSFLGMALFGMMQLFQALSIDPDFQATPSANPSDLDTAIRKCEAGILSSVNNPSTVDIHRFTGFGNNKDASGTIRITQTFSAKNSFGAEQTFDALCSLTASGFFNISIAEQGR